MHYLALRHTQSCSSVAHDISEPLLFTILHTLIFLSAQHHHSSPSLLKYTHSLFMYSLMLPPLLPVWYEIVHHMPQRWTVRLLALSAAVHKRKHRRGGQCALKKGPLCRQRSAEHNSQNPIIYALCSPLSWSDTLSVQVFPSQLLILIFTFILPPFFSPLLNLTPCSVFLSSPCQDWVISRTCYLVRKTRTRKTSPATSQPFSCWKMRSRKWKVCY